VFAYGITDSEAYAKDETVVNDESEIYYFNIFILYKELNEEYRKIFLSNLQELG
jgi:hypothetical protein